MQADYYIIRLIETDILPKEQLIDRVIEANGYVRGTATVDFQFTSSIDDAYMTALYLKHQEKSGRQVDNKRSKMHNISGGAEGKLTAIFYTKEDTKKNITTQMIKTLREKSGAGIMDCRSALVGCGGDIDKALNFLKEKGLLKAQKKAERTTSQGLIEAYIHTAGRIGAMVELNCETGFVARTDEYKQLAHCLAMQVAALAPKYISEEEVKEGEEIDPKEACLLAQPYIKDPTRTVKDIIVETIAKVGENIRVRRFIRYELGN